MDAILQAFQRLSIESLKVRRNGLPNRLATCPNAGNPCQTLWRPVQALGQLQKPIIIKQLNILFL
jgi:hypothetical protein